MSARVALDIFDQLTADLEVGGRWSPPSIRTASRKKQTRVPTGEGNQDELALDQIEDYLFDYFPELRLRREEQQFVLIWFVRFYSTYLTCLSDHFAIDVKWQDFNPTCGMSPDSFKDLSSVISLCKRMCLSPMTDLLQDQSGRVNCYPLSGKARRTLKRRLTRVNAKTLSFANSVLQMKRVSPKVPQSFVKSQLVAASERLQLPCRQSATFMNIVQNEVEKMCREFGFRPWNPKPTDEIKNISQRATIESNRLEGGGYGWYFGGYSYEDNYDYAGNFRPFVRVFEGGPDRVLTYKRRVSLTVGDCIREAKDLLSVGFPMRRLIGVCEPLKVRTITVHHAWEPALWSGYQKHMAAENRRVPQILSGKSEFIDGVWEDFPNDIRDIFREAVSHYEALGMDWTLVSADASAATDSIHPLTTLAGSTGSLSNEHCPDLDWLFRNTWTGVYPDPALSKKKQLESEPLLQTNGQAMGDRRSFGLLCRIHYALNSRFCERHRLPKAFAINGDDGLIILPKALVKEYFAFAEELWEVNILKTYVSDMVFSFNSQFYYFPSFKRVGIVRYSLIRGQDKFGEMSQDPRVFNTVLATNTVLSESHLFGMFHRFWKKRLDRLCRSGNNYFLPLCCGGLGLHPPRDRVWTTTRQQRHAIIIADAKLERGVSQLETRTVGVGKLPMTTILNGVAVRTTNPKEGEDVITTPSQLKVDSFESVRLVPPVLNGAVDYIPFEEETIERLWGTSRVIRPFF